MSPSPATLPDPAGDPRPAWLAALAASLAEALPRLHGVQGDPALDTVIAALTGALAEGQLELLLADPEQRRAVAASPLASDPWGPLVLEGERLLWRRWHAQRQQVLEALIQRAGQPSALAEAGPVPALARLDSDQQRAVAAVLNHRLVLLEGGPGTGKTSTVAGMLEAVRERNGGARMHLAAPTGKAAARLRANLAPSEAVPCTTVHRLLESQGERFGRNRQHPLELDLLVIDEVSMLDLALMQAVLEALPAQASLVLVGDGAQLPPVGPGPVLLELQRADRRQALGPAAVELRTTYRNGGAIAELAASLRPSPGPKPVDAAAQGSGDWRHLIPQLRQLQPGANLAWRQASPRRLPGELLERLQRQQQELRRLCDSTRPGDQQAEARLLAQLDALLVLTPVRRGRWGVEAIHRALLGERLEQPVQQWPLGTPVLCQQNLPELGLANGDVGILTRPAAGQEPRLLFGVGGGEHLWLHPAQLPARQPALALTVHKAQGSEAEEVWILMPDTGRPSDRLLYTALTRARQRAELITPEGDKV
ncbi:ATP-dependent RecD-like DNA helicase [Cyanobium sp. NS01]|uniref:ATP-dependent DNA helicase n=1 Tax=Cyanobium sp. NS01 TaxID=261284 RepID=UPI0018600D4F|nr:AAA family ATPase [Cyanobium sp. NS01]QNI71136.1 exodeoxyribonuclease V (RecBCD complex)/ alpha subunit [Cyanobium sp. NS01]